MKQSSYPLSFLFLFWNLPSPSSWCFHSLSHSWDASLILSSSSLPVKDLSISGHMEGHTRFFGIRTTKTGVTSHHSQGLNPRALSSCFNDSRNSFFSPKRSLRLMIEIPINWVTEPFCGVNSVRTLPMLGRYLVER